MISPETLQVCAFDLPGVGDEEQLRITDAIAVAILDREDSGADWYNMSYKARAANRSDFFSMYGSLFFLGIILSIVFLAAAALIIQRKGALKVMPAREEIQRLLLQQNALCSFA